LLLETVDLAEGECFTYLPEGTDRGQVTDFIHGGVASLEASKRCVEQVVRQHVVTRGPGIFVAENASAGCTDLAIRRDPKGVFCYGEEVYHWAEASAQQPADVRSVMTRASSWVLNCVVTSLPSAAGAAFVFSNCTLATLETLAERTTLIVAKAYDGEGYVTWVRS
ncbi:MAG: hypothetical protein ACRDHJ_12330, partial [Actinomycetota bacterium]